ncbi:hypothetical protein ACIGKQ_10830 [Gordonia sp. NPDC062954]|uniref:hypothetical protein n=1 Tax=Gordonia sp. NPDC062954 TaxID=3364003 RepID=UPI0037C7AB76
MNSVASMLLDAGVRVLSGTTKHIEYLHQGQAVRADIDRYDRLPPTLKFGDRHRRQLVVCDSASDRARAAALAEPCIDLVINEPREVILSGHTYQRVDRTHPQPRSRAFGSAAVERVIMLATQPMRQTDIADAAGITQQAVSKHLARTGAGPTPLSETEREQMLEGWLARYRPTLEETYWYGLDDTAVQVREVMSFTRELDVRAQIGGEIAADLMRPWRVPTRGVVYADELIDLTPLGLVPAGSDDATVTLRVSADHTVAATARWWSTHHGGLTDIGDVVDPVMALWDLTTGPDLGDDALEELRAWIQSRRSGDDRVDIQR